MSPILGPNTLEFFSRGAEQTRRVGMRVGGLLQTGDIVALVGDLGAGKTTFVQGIVAGWGSLDQVSSPTFVLVNVYRHPGGGQLFHLDAYRLQGAGESDDLDLDAIQETGPMVIEWADRLRAALPEEGLWVQMQWMSEEHRLLQFFAHGKRYQALLDKLKLQMYRI